MSDTGIIIALPRVGKDGRIINVYKIRTMCPGAQAMQGLVYSTCGLDVGGKFKDDPRITPLGKYLRRYFIDEIPQIVNLIKGDIKLFGVRPISSHYLSLYSEEVRERRIRYTPGLISPIYFDCPKTFEEIVKSEINYLNSYDRHPYLTDAKYLFKVLVNILFKSVRSQ